MSIDSARLALQREHQSDILACEARRLGGLRALFKYTQIVADNRPPQENDWPYNNPPGQNEASFLEENNLSIGRRFDDATLPWPNDNSEQHPPLPSTLPFQAPLKPPFPVLPKSSQSSIVGAPSLEDQLRAASASPSVATQPLPPTKPTTQKDPTHAVKSLSPASRTGPSSPATAADTGNQVANNIADDARAASSNGTSPAPAVQHAVGVDASVSDGPSIAPSAVNTPDVDLKDEAATAESKPKAPQVVHLPPKDVQEARLHETERKLEKIAEKERKDDFHANGPTDLISSPSSTVGPYSQATPHAPHHSPDTSPDTESFQERPRATLQTTESLDPAAQQVKEDHERALQKEMTEARERARGTESPTPDIEKQIEDEQAIRLARDGKSRLAGSTTEQRTGLMSHAKDIARDAAPAGERFVEVRASQDPAADSLPTPTTTAPEPSTVDPEATDRETNKVAEADSHPTPPAELDVEMGDAPTSTNPRSPPVHPSRPDRMTTRVSSGAMRQKSVSEILAEKAAPKTVLTPRSSNLSTSASPPRPKTRDPRSKEVVVFAKKTPRRGSKALQAYDEDYASLHGASEDSSRDYLEGLFKYQAHHPPRSIPLQELVASARKTVTTAGTLAMHREHQDYKILKRVYQLQNANRWSLRQLQKSVEPERPFTHHDQLLLEMKNISTDFQEERRWKEALAASFAEWCAKYVNSSPEERATLRVNVRKPIAAKQVEHHDEDMDDAPTPDLVQSHAHETESESFADEDELRTPLSANPPTGLFSLGFNDVVMKIHRTPASDTMFRELPFYEPMLEGSSDGNPFSVAEPPILPVSKYVTGKLVSQIRGPPRKRSRYDYDSEDEPSTPPSRSGTSAEHSMPSTPGRRLFCRNDLPPEMTDVALFNAENKHVRDRLQAAHQFRPPTEFNMPSVAFFEHRIPSQWLWEEDQKLRSLVKEFTFNWSLVSQQLSLPSMFVSGSGRRTPWECFERWVQLEGLPAEMSKTQYFRTYQGRLEQANKTVFAQYQAQQQQQQQQGAAPAQPRRRPTTTPIRVERRRENRYLAIIDGMRKLARKRESAAHKQAESQKAAALRKAHEPAPPKNTVHTPQEFSRLKWEREEKLKLRQQQQEMAVRQQMVQQRQQAQMAAQGGMPNGANQMLRNGTSMGNPTGSAHMANSASQQGQNAAAMAARAHQGQQGMQANFGNGNMAGMPMGTSGVPQAQMQGNMQNGQRMAPPNQMQMAMQRGQFPNSAQQQFQLQQQQHQLGMGNNLTPGMGLNSNIPNANMMASMSNQNMNGNINGNINATMNGLPNNVGSPRPNQGNGNMQTPSRPLSSGHMPNILHLQNVYKVQHPEWTNEQCQKAASEHLQKSMAKTQRTQAMNAAAGSSGMSPSPQIGNNQYLPQNGSMANSPQPGNNPAVANYQQQLVQQQRMMQQSRQQAGSPGMNAARPASRSATPQNPQMLQSPGMQQAQVNRSS
ncbi:vacuolar import and degradation protein 21 [Parastagonospora nodorum]|nr:vacuolar import and degradation protein 21 [Parastagonospora nodorum]